MTSDKKPGLKIRKGFILCPVQGETMAVSTGSLDKDFPGLIKMNQTAADIWKWIEEGKELEEIYRLFADTYKIDDETAHNDVDSLVQKMQEAGIFE